MEWLKGNKENLNPIECVSVKKAKYFVKLSPKPYTPTEEGDTADTQYLSVVHLGAPTTYDIKQMLIRLQKDYDESDEVNCFYVDGKNSWIDKATRVGLVNTCAVLKADGETKYKLWLNNTPYELPITFIEQLLHKIEKYAIECYQVKETHLAEIDKLKTREEILTYNISKGYPKKISIDSNEIND